MEPALSDLPPEEEPTRCQGKILEHPSSPLHPCPSTVMAQEENEPQQDTALCPLNVTALEVSGLALKCPTSIGSQEPYLNPPLTQSPSLVRPFTFCKWETSRAHYFSFAGVSNLILT